MSLFAACINDWPVLLGMFLAFLSGLYAMAASVLFVGRQRALRALALRERRE